MRTQTVDARQQTNGGMKYELSLLGTYQGWFAARAETCTVLP